MKTNRKILMANVIHAVSAILCQAAGKGEETSIRSTGRKAGQSVSHGDSVAIEIKNRLTVGDL